MTRPVSLTVRARVGDDHGPMVTVRGPFPGDHARYVLRSRITVLDTLGAAA